MSQYLKILHKASTSDVVSIDLLHIQALRAKKPRNQDLQVLDELIIYFWKQNPGTSAVAQGLSSVLGEMGAGDSS